MRLRCRAHNQYEAERALGSGFMEQKRQEARLAAAETRARNAAAEPAAQRNAAAEPAAQEVSRDVLAGLRRLGCRADEARRAVDSCVAPSGTTLEERMSLALKSLGQR